MAVVPIIVLLAYGIRGTGAFGVTPLRSLAGFQSYPLSTRIPCTFLESSLLPARGLGLSTSQPHRRALPLRAAAAPASPASSPDSEPAELSHGVGYATSLSSADALPPLSSPRSSVTAPPRAKLVTRLLLPLILARKAVARYRSYTEELSHVAETELSQSAQLRRLLSVSDELAELLNRIGARTSVEGAASLTALRTALVSELEQEEAAAAASVESLVLAEEAEAMALGHTRKEVLTKKDLAKRVVSGWALAAVASAWIFSGGAVFSLTLFALCSLAQLEFYRAAQAAHAANNRLSTRVPPGCTVAASTSADAGAAASAARERGGPNELRVDRTFGLCATALLFGAAGTGSATFHALSLPLVAGAGLSLCLWCRDEPPPIADVAAALLGVFYVGFLASFYIRLKAFAGTPGQAAQAAQAAVSAQATAGVWTAAAGTAAAGTAAAGTAAAGTAAEVGGGAMAAVAAIAAAVSNQLGLTFGAQFFSFTAFTPGALAMWWCSFAVVCADVGAYFGGKRFGSHKLKVLGGGALGVASPNKTVEGFVAGCVSAAAASLCGAWHMGWPWFGLSGPAFGLGVGFLGFLGDLTASTFKRDARLKDYGSLFPGHGGVLDRFDSYLFVAPFAFFFVARLLPAVAIAVAR